MRASPQRSRGAQQCAPELSSPAGVPFNHLRRGHTSNHLHRGDAGAGRRKISELQPLAPCVPLPSACAPLEFQPPVVCSPPLVPAFLLNLRLSRSAFLLNFSLPLLSFFLILSLLRSAFLSHLCPNFLAQSMNCRNKPEEGGYKHCQKSSPYPGNRCYNSPNFRAHRLHQAPSLPVSLP